MLQRTRVEARSGDPVGHFREGTFLTRSVAVLSEEVRSVEAELQLIIDRPSEQKFEATLVVTQALLALDKKPPNGAAAKALEISGLTGIERYPELLTRLVGLLELTTLTLGTAGISKVVPYLMDPLSGGYRLNRGSRADPSSRRPRKVSGTFFTPPDVVESMASWAVAQLPESDLVSILDPCCGTGVFLIELVQAYVARGSLQPQQVVRQIEGYDLDERSLEVAANMIHWAAFGTDDPHFDANLALVRSRLHRRDSTSLVESAEHRQRFDLVIANPPYGRFSEAGIQRERAADFLKLLRSVVSPKGVGTMVVPASIVSARTGAMHKERLAMIDAGGRWEFLNYDRSPDSLFGDDVKQRCSIVRFSASGETEIRTSSLLRWSRDRRHAALNSRRTIKVEPGRGGFVPRIERPIESQVAEALSKRTGEVTWRRSQPLAAGLRSDEVSVATTAYNWLGVLRGPLVLDLQRLSSSPRHVVGFRSEQHASVAYAVLSSRLAFWWWRCSGDGFHVSKTLVEDMAPLWSGRPNPELAELGRGLGEGARRNPVLSTNAGSVTVAYVVDSADERLSEVDGILLGALGLSSRAQDQFIATVLNRPHGFIDHLEVGTSVD